MRDKKNKKRVTGDIWTLGTTIVQQKRTRKARIPGLFLQDHLGPLKRQGDYLAQREREREIGRYRDNEREREKEIRIWRDRDSEKERKKLE